VGWQWVFPATSHFTDRVTGELSKYSGSSLPREDIGLNVLKSLNVPADRTKQVWDMILKSAESVGFLQTIKERMYVNLGGVRDSGLYETSGKQAPNPPLADSAVVKRGKVSRVWTAQPSA
jgi:hypothetical protein